MFSLREVRKLDEPVRKIAIMLIDEFKDRGECEICVDLAQRVPIYVFLEMPGLPGAECAKQA